MAGLEYTDELYGFMCDRSGDCDIGLFFWDVRVFHFRDMYGMIFLC